MFFLFIIIIIIIIIIITVIIIRFDKESLSWVTFAVWTYQE